MGPASSLSQLSLSRNLPLLASLPEALLAEDGNNIAAAVEGTLTRPPLSQFVPSLFFRHFGSSFLQAFWNAGGDLSFAGTHFNDFSLFFRALSLSLDRSICLNQRLVSPFSDEHHPARPFQKALRIEIP